MPSGGDSKTDALCRMALYQGIGEGTHDRTTR